MICETIWLHQNNSVSIESITPYNGSPIKIQWPKQQWGLDLNELREVFSESHQWILDHPLSWSEEQRDYYNSLEVAAAIMHIDETLKEYDGK
jgi:hypothetical protein